MDQLGTLLDQAVLLIFTHIQEIVAAAIGLLALKVRTKVLEYFNRNALDKAVESATAIHHNDNESEDKIVDKIIGYVKEFSPESIAKIKPELLPVVILGKYLAKKAGLKKG